MEQKQLKIKEIPAIIYGEYSEKIYIFVHGQGGNKEEAKFLSEIVCNNGYQVLSIDLPEHGERKTEKNTFNPWNVVPQLKEILEYSKSKWSKISLYANSIGAYFSLLSFKDELFENCLFVSPILDMNHLIKNMMKWSNVTEEQLEKQKIIKTNFEQTLSWEYLNYVRKYPILKWKSPTNILYAQDDNLIDYCIVDNFVKQFNCKLTIVQECEHYFHTPKQLKILSEWIKENF